MKRMLIGTLVGALTLGAVGTGRKAQAGDKEWAVAGKILAGVMVLDALTTPRRGPVYRERHVVHHVPTYHQPPVVYHPAPYSPPVVYRRPVHVYRRPVHVYRSTPTVQTYGRRTYRSTRTQVYDGGHRRGYSRGSYGSSHRGRRSW